MRAAVPATSVVLGLVLGACGRGDATRDRAPIRAPAPARDARPRAGVTQAEFPRDTPTPARPHSVPSAGVPAGTVAPAAAAGDDAPPRMRNARPPFRYPGALYARRVQGNVTLRLWVDSAGRVRPESTRVSESSGARLLDSAAVAGSTRLEFTPARHDGRATGAPLLFPVHFRHPAAH